MERKFRDTCQPDLTRENAVSRAVDKQTEHYHFTPVARSPPDSSLLRLFTEFTTTFQSDCILYSYLFNYLLTYLLNHGLTNGSCNRVKCCYESIMNSHA